MPRINLTQHFRLANFTPRCSANWRKRETCFVPQNQVHAESLRFFLMRFHVCSAQYNTSSSSCLCDLTIGICTDRPSVGSRARTARGVNVTLNVICMRWAMILDVQRSVEEPALMAPSSMICLSCCFCFSLSLEGLPEPCCRERQVLSSLCSSSFFLHCRTAQVLTSRISQNKGICQ